MQMTLTITAETPSEMVTVLQALQTAGVSEPVRMVAEPAKVLTPIQEALEQVAARVGQTAPAPRRGRPPKNAAPAPEPEPQKTEPAKFKVVPKEEPAPKPKKELTSLDVREALTKYMAANSETATGELLKKHGGGVMRLSQLAPEYYEAVYAAAVTPITDPMDDEIPDLTK